MVQTGSDRSSTATLPEESAGFQGFSRNYLIYAVGLMGIVQVLNYLDRQIMVILLEPIRRDFGFSDAQGGLLTGFAFSLFYLTFVLPAARLADRVSRRKLLAGALALWSIMTGLCGLAGNYMWLLVARFGVGVGEAGALPSIHSMISDYLPQRRRGIAMSVLSVGIVVGVMCGLSAGGWLADRYGWRTAFLAAMVPGLFVSLIVFLTLRDPPRGFADGITTKVEPVPMRAALITLWRRPTYRNTVIGISLAAIGYMGTAAWTAPYFIRTHGMSASEVGFAFALIHGTAGVAGSLLGGALGDWINRFDKRGHLWVVCLSVVVTPFLFTITYLLEDARLAMWAYGITTIFLSMWYGPFYAVQQSLAGVRNRAIAASAGTILFNFVGTGLGPLIIGSLSDSMASDHGVLSLRYGLLMIQPVFVIGLFFLMRGLRTLREDLVEGAKA